MKINENSIISPRLSVQSRGLCEPKVLGDFMEEEALG